MLKLINTEQINHSLIEPLKNFSEPTLSLTPINGSHKPKTNQFPHITPQPTKAQQLKPLYPSPNIADQPTTHH